MKKWIAVGVLVLAGVVWGAAETLGNWDAMAEYRPALFKKGVYIGFPVGANRVTADVQNKLTAFRSVQRDYDFPSTSPAVTTSPGWAEMSTTTRLGVKYSDECRLVVNFGIDGGSSLATLAPNGRLDCRTVTDGVVGRFTVLPVLDGGTGAVDLTDAGYTFFIFSNQTQN